MKTRHYFRWLIPLAIIGFFLVYSLLLASGGYTISWYTVDGGGATFSTGEEYRLGHSTGQPDAGASSGSTYTLRGGFWAGVEPAATKTPPETFVYLPFVTR